MTRGRKPSRWDESSIRWVLTTAKFDSRIARLRAFWWCIVRRYRYEICSACGRPVGRYNGSWWRAPDALWMAIIGTEYGVRCMRCFSAACDAAGRPIHWKAVEGV